MLKKPQLRSQFRIETVREEYVFLLSERGAILLSDRLNNLLFSLLFPLLDGNHTSDDIVEKLESAEIPASYIYYALMEMEKKGYLMENQEVLPENLALFCQHLHVKPEDGYSRLKDTKVTVTVLGSVSAAELSTQMESLHIQIGEPGNLEIVLTNDYLQPELWEINQQNLERSRPWMLVKPVGTILWLGPIFQPGKTGCWECLAQRLRNNRPVEGFIHRHNHTSHPLTPPLTDLPSIQSTALNIAATEVLKWIIDPDNPRLAGVIVSYDTLTLETRNHPIIKRPQCPTCGILKPEQYQFPPVLGSRKKMFTADGGHRTLTPETTLEKYRHHISPITGVVRQLEKISPNLNNLAPMYIAKHHCVSIWDDLRQLQQNLGGRSAGKGKTEAQAKASALGEAIERYSGIFQGDEVRIKGSYQQLVDRAIHPHTYMNFSPRQYDRRQEWNTQASLFQQVPEPFDETRERDWTPVWSFTHQDWKYLPTAYCYFGYPIDLSPDCWATTNGCAAGNTLEEALLQGFMELVERDSVALWWYNRIPRPKVDLASFQEPYFLSLENYYQSIQRELWVIDITSDLDIPTFAAISRRCDRPVEDIIFGFGTHFDPKLALQRALTEINQILPGVLAANADGTTQYAPSADPTVLDWWKTATLVNQPYLAPAPVLCSKVHGDYTQICHDDLLADIKLCQQIVEKHGMEMLLLDQTRPDIGLRVVRVIVPGMRHFWKRLGAGRLYDIPVKLGWLPRPTPEEQLNPVPMWM